MGRSSRSLALLLLYPLGVLHVTQKNTFCSKREVMYLNPVEDAAVARLHGQAEGVLADSPGLREHEIKGDGRGRKTNLVGVEEIVDTINSNRDGANEGHDERARRNNLPTHGLMTEVSHRQLAARYVK